MHTGHTHTQTHLKYNQFPVHCFFPNSFWNKRSIYSSTHSTIPPFIAPFILPSYLSARLSDLHSFIITVYLLLPSLTLNIKIVVKQKGDALLDRYTVARDLDWVDWIWMLWQYSGNLMEFYIKAVYIFGTYDLRRCPSTISPPENTAAKL